MANWRVQIIRMYNQTAEIEVDAETEQEAIHMAEEIVEEDDWSDYTLLDQYIEEASKI
tara:strand:- start:281 stop:454 length:174 start_codon:yes stop_codon:yes gene_type:complete